MVSAPGASAFTTRVACGLFLLGQAEYVPTTLDNVARTVIDKGSDFNHGYTYSGHPVACATAVANIRLMQRERVVEQVRELTGPYLKAKFEALKEHPLVGEAESCGLMAGLVLVKGKSPIEMFDPKLGVGMVCRGHMFGNGMIMRAVGERMIIAPPLVITTSQIDEMIALIRRCLDATLADLKARGWM